MRNNLDLNAYNKIIGMFENMPQIPNMDNDEAESLQSSAIVSIAISLKRIADKLELSQKQPIMMTAEEAEKVGYRFPPNEKWIKS